MVGSSNTFDIDSLVYPSNEYVVDDKLAPSSSGYFDIIIDATGSSVAVRFDVTLDTDNLDDYDAISFTAAYRVINDVETVGSLVRTGNKTYSGIISLSDIEDEIESKVRFYIGWEDDESEEGNISDTQLGQTLGVSTDLPVTVVCTQYMGETLVPYVVATS